MVCKNCGKEIHRHKAHKFCSLMCYKAYRRNHGATHTPPPINSEILRVFECRCCGKKVYVWEKKDKRTVFCCQPCERKYWRDVTRHDNANHKRGGNQGMSGGMSLNSLIRRELRDLE
ncbi:MAG: hypothetical protein J6M62_02505 [Selenomonadaceae bacterium]|nr:hypothetical protein [Selenomonadaceae bacterium]MBP3723797.1 hypothetical protein [Selenomonadaceae bacterium]